MKLLRHLALGASFVMLAACATTTPYQAASKPSGFDGYSQTMIEHDRARVTFGGNSLTDRETVQNYLLYRAAEMAVERGFEHFSLADREVEEKKRITSSPGLRHGIYDPYFHYSFYRPRYGWSRYHRYSHFYSPFHRRRHFGFHSPYYDPFFDDFHIREVTKYRASAEVVFGRGTRPDGPNAFNAKEVLDNLGPTIVYPEESQ